MLGYEDLTDDNRVFTPIPLWRQNADDVPQLRHDLKMKDEFVELLVDNYFRYTRIEEIALSRLVTYQSVLDGRKLEKFIGSLGSGGKDWKPPLVFDLPDGTLLLHDGNHRVAAARELGYSRVEVLIRSMENDVGDGDTGVRCRVIHDMACGRERVITGNVPVMWNGEVEYADPETLSDALDGYLAEWHVRDGDAVVLEFHDHGLPYPL